MSAVVIGSYCSDFTVMNPTSASDFCFYKSGNYYLASNLAMRNVVSGSFTADMADDIKIIQKSFYKPTNGSITPASDGNTPLEWFTEFKFKPIWSPTISGDFSTTPVIPADERRFLSSTLHPTISTTEANRFVKLESKNNNSGGFKFVGSAVADATACQKFRPQTGATSSPSFTDQNIKDLIFTPTHESPIVSTSSVKGVYIVLKSDWDRRTEAVTAAKQMRYLVYDPAASVSAFRLVDLYDPDITESIVKSCFYRITNGEYVTLDQSTITDATTFTSATKTSTWGIKAYVSSTTPANFLASTALTIPSLLSDADPTSGIGAAIDLNSAFFNDNNGTSVINDFTSSTGSASTLNSSTYINDGFEGSYITKSVNYIDHTNGYANTSSAAASRLTQEFIFVTQVFDKRVEELFSNVSVTLLRLVQPSSGVPAASPVAGDNNNYLGLEHVIPNNSVTVDNGSISGTNIFTPSTGNTGIGLIVRDYFKFFNPARATQFKFYDLGNNSEYIWQANFQAGASNPYAYVTVDSDKIQLLTRIADQNQRGWILEYDNTMTPPGVRLKWAATGKYVDVNKNTGTDSAPMRIDSFNSGSTAASTTTHTLTATKSSAAIFNCIVCSSIDASGACRVPTTIDSMSGTLPNARTTPVGAQISISSPTSPNLFIEDSIPFVIKTAVTGNYIRYALSQFSSPTAAVVSGSLDTSPSPTPSDPYVSEFILTQRGGVMPDKIRNRRAFFIKAANMPNGENYYLRADPNTGNVRMVQTNLPSDAEGYLWLIIRTATAGAGVAGIGNSVNFISVINANLSNNYDGNGAYTNYTSRYLQTDGSSIGSNFTPTGTSSPPRMFNLEATTPGNPQITPNTAGFNNFGLATNSLNPTSI